MKLFYSLTLLFVFISPIYLTAQNVNYEVRVVELMAKADADDGGFGSFLYGDQDPTWFVRAQDNAGVGFNAAQCKHVTNQWGDWWNLADYTLITGSNSSATQINVQMECWEKDACGGNCTYRTFNANPFSSGFCLDGDDNYASMGNVSGSLAPAGQISFKNDPACQWNEYLVSRDGAGSPSNGYEQYWAKIQIRWEYTNFDAGSDDAVCDSVIGLNATGNGTWSVSAGNGGFFSNNADPNATFTGQPGETYTLTWSSLPGCINASNSSNAIIEIYGLPEPNLSASADSICEGESVTFYAENGLNYDWTINSGSSVIQTGVVDSFSTNSLIQGDTVFVSLTDINSCLGSDFYSIDVSPLPILNLGNDTTICDGFSLLIDGTTPFVTYLWGSGENTSSITVSDSGTYELTVTNNYDCSATDSIDVNLFPNPVVDLGLDDTINEIDFIDLDAGAGFSSYNWSTGGSSSIETVYEFGEYWVQITDANGCIAFDTIVVTQIQNNLFLPTMFTPNNDGKNDVLLLYGNGLSEDILFQIYNRWGEVVYSTTSLSILKSEGWNGKFNNIDQPTGVYLWTLIANDSNGNAVDFSLIDNLKSSGSILLKR